MAHIMRVERDGDIRVYRLLPPDEAGNANWALVAELRGSDRVPMRCCPEKTVPARAASDADIVAALRGELAEEGA